jgi:hypothetical protein
MSCSGRGRRNRWSLAAELSVIQTTEGRVKRTASWLALGTLLLSSRPAYTCVCVETGGLADELRSSRAVFLGRIVALSIDPIFVGGTEVERMRATFRVEHSWKGVKGRTVDVLTCGTQTVFCTCRADFRLGERYVVFASGQPLGTGSCNRTAPAGSSEGVVAELDNLSRR